MYFLTDGHQFIGPFDPAEISAPARVRAALEHEGATVYRIEADTLEQAMRKWRLRKR